MSDELEGWDKIDGGFCKLIGYQIYHIERDWALDCWNLCIHDDRKQFLTDRPTLAECQHLAHATDRLWAGDTT